MLRQDQFLKSTICGSPAFMAPELLEKSETFTTKVDM